MPRIVPARLSDANDVRACVHASYAEYIERIGREPAPMGADYEALIDAGEVWVVRAGGSVAGVLVVRPEPPALLLRERGGRAGASRSRARPGAGRVRRGAGARGRPRGGDPVHERAHDREPAPLPTARLRRDGPAGRR